MGVWGFGVKGFGPWSPWRTKGYYRPWKLERGNMVSVEYGLLSDDLMCRKPEIRPVKV